MKLNLIKQLRSKNGKVKVAFEVDEELLQVYRSETGEDEFEEESFHEWLNDLIKYAIEEENLRYEE